jgi:hypothetical protein
MSVVEGVTATKKAVTVSNDAIAAATTLVLI